MNRDGWTPERVRIASAIQSRPGQPFAAIARDLDLSKERVRQVAKLIGVRSPHYHGIRADRGDFRCPGCGGQKRLTSKRCLPCKLRAQHLVVTCAVCGKGITRRRSDVTKILARPDRKQGPFFYCGRGAHKEEAWQELPCDTCGAPVTRHMAELRRRKRRGRGGPRCGDCRTAAMRQARRRRKEAAIASQLSL